MFLKWWWCATLCYIQINSLYFADLQFIIHTSIKLQLTRFLITWITFTYFRFQQNTITFYITKSQLPKPENIILKINLIISTERHCKCAITWVTMFYFIRIHKWLCIRIMHESLWFILLEQYMHDFGSGFIKTIHVWLCFILLEQYMSDYVVSEHYMNEYALFY